MFSTWRDNGVVQMFFSRHLKSSSVWECFFPSAVSWKCPPCFKLVSTQRPPKSEFSFKLYLPTWAYLCKPFQKHANGTSLAISPFLHVHPERSFFFRCAKCQTVPPQNTFICSCGDARFSYKNVSNKVSEKQLSKKIVWFNFTAHSSCCATQM